MVSKIFSLELKGWCRNLRLEMLQVARLAPKLLGDSTALVAEFFKSQRQPDGGYCDREGKSDLYYSVFGLEGAIALQQPLPTALLYDYVRSFGEAQDLDLIHVACLARCWAALPVNFQQECPIEMPIDWPD